VEMGRDGCKIKDQNEKSKMTVQNVKMGGG